MGIEILSIKSSLPKKFETLKELSMENKNWDTKKIYASTGINKRYIASESENIVTLSIKSAKKMLLIMEDVIFFLSEFSLQYHKILDISKFRILLRKFNCQRKKFNNAYY